MIPLRFTAADAERAFDDWGANCGPGAIAAICGLSLDALRPQMGDFERKRYTNPTLMWATLRNLGVRFKVNTRAPSWPEYGLARVQWEGPWTAPGVPERARYRHTHWVGAQWSAARREYGIFDINAMCQTAAGPYCGWTSLEDWRGFIVPWILERCEPEADGRWHLTHSVEIERASLTAAGRAERIDRLATVMLGIAPWLARNKGRSVAEVVECPACKGRLRLSIAASNGRVRGRCQTEGCVSWAE